MIATALTSADDMAAEKKANTEQVGVRLNKPQLERLRAYANSHPMQPSLTRLIDMAIGEWLVAHETEVDPPKKRERT